MRVKPYAFPRTVRLLTAEDYAQSFAGGQRQQDAWFRLIFAPSPAPFARLGLIVSKKNCKRSVDRQRVKRQIRESFRQHHADLPALDVVVMAKANIAHADNAVLRASLQAHYGRILRKMAGKNAEIIQTT